jgi:hypothetical protein
VRSPVSRGVRRTSPTNNSGRCARWHGTGSLRCSHEHLDYCHVLVIHQTCRKSRGQLRPAGDHATTLAAVSRWTILTPGGRARACASSIRFPAGPSPFNEGQAGVGVTSGTSWRGSRCPCSGLFERPLGPLGVGVRGHQQLLLELAAGFVINQWNCPEWASLPLTETMLDNDNQEPGGRDQLSGPVPGRRVVGAPIRRPEVSEHIPPPSDGWAVLRRR